MFFCLSAGLCAVLLVALLFLLCAACALGYRAIADGLSFCLPVPGVLLLVVTLLPVADLCRLHLLCFHVFSCPAVSLAGPC